MLNDKEQIMLQIKSDISMLYLDTHVPVKLFMLFDIFPNGS